MQHDWVKSTLGHGETMCSRCKVTNREAAAIGMVECDVPPPTPANDPAPPTLARVHPLAPESSYLDDEDDDYLVIDDEEDDEMAEAEANCGEMPDGGCSLAGTEYCDWRCPFSDAMRKRLDDESESDHTFDDGDGA